MNSFIKHPRLPNLALLVLLFLLNQVASAEPVRELEPNNTIASAQPVRPIVSIGGVINNSSDVDYYAFYASTGESIQADILAQGFRASSQPGSDLSAKLSLIDSDGSTVLAEKTPTGSYDDPCVIYTFSQPGTYYLKVADQFNTGGSGHIYILSIERELPDNVKDKGTWITPPVFASIDALLQPPGDIDEYKFFGNANQVVTIDIDSAVFNPVNPAAETIVQLLDENNSVLTSDAYNPVSDPNDPYIQYTLPAAGLYRIIIKERRSYVGTSNTFYQLSVDLSPTTTNNSYNSASPVSLPRSVSGTLAPDGTTNYYGFTTSATSTIIANMDASENLLSLISNSTLALHNSSGQVDSNSSTPDPILSTSTNLGTYAVSVSGNSSGLNEDTYYVLYIDNDIDADNLYLPYDNCPLFNNPLQNDSDNDGVGDSCDICPMTFNPDQNDFDNDGLGNACDPDNDNDGLNDQLEHQIGTDPYNIDTDEDGLSDYAEVAYDGDAESFIFFSDLNPLWWDTDFDGVDDSSDTAPLDFNFNDGDLAPLGNPDGLINAADLVVCTKIALGIIDPTGLELSHGDIYPEGSPDGIINAQDMLLLMKKLQMMSAF